MADRTCTLAGWTRRDAEVSFRLDASLENDHSIIVCSGWMTPGQDDLPPAPASPDDPASDADCVAVPPGGWTTRALGRPPADALALRIRVSFGDADDTASLRVDASGDELYSAPLDACGLAVWTFEVYP